MNDFLFAFRQSLPVFFAYFPLGIVFGILFVHEGYSPIIAPIMSALAYSGAVQFLALTMFKAGSPLVTIIVTVFFVAFRNVFYGLSFFDRFAEVKGFKRLFLIFTLVDGSYAIFLTNPKASLKFCLQVSAILYFSWVIGTVIGVLCADFLPEIKGLSFILTSFFMVLVIDLYLKYKNPMMLIVPIVASFVSYALLPGHYLLLAVALCIAFISLKPRDKGLSDE